MKRLSIAIFAILFLSMQQSIAQKSPSFNHTTIFVVDMNKSAEFYEKAMMFKRIAEPFHDNRHIWMKIGEHSQLHIVQGASSTTQHDINIHLAFSVPSVEEFAKHFDEMNVKYGNWKQNSKQPEIRPDGIKQIYFQDPDGYWIEINNDTF